ncbi:hypothetical protein ACFQ05_04705 [Amycolatopsis umgeniensis]|uniref:Uncharacterized protein n=1 Tax=Amycolatopsis umgeniensis TaxID=336628 RepID=A0A841B2H8_9PSEU|nr:hypothetical protein [Amycolatopsis umgeniensis]MBB5852568.1 hypothetical protein [Amycolatopsis umgeniensis]
MHSLRQLEGSQMQGVARRSALTVSGLVLGLSGLLTSTASASEGWRLEQPLDSTGNRIYFDVTATGAGDAWTVGSAWTGSAEVPVAVRWDGAKWADTTPAPVTGTSARFTEISASAPDNVWVAGDRSAEAGTRRPARLPNAAGPRAAASTSTVVQRWDGKTWTDIARPKPPAGMEGFTAGIAAFSPSSVWLVSVDFDLKTGKSAHHLEHWTRKTWETVEIPQTGSRPLLPTRVSGTGDDDLWVSATSVAADGKETPFLLHRTGGGWRQVEVPVPSDYRTGWVVNHVVPDGRGSAYVVGRVNEWNATGIPAFVTRWDGQKWSSLPSVPFDEINAAALDGSGKLWTAGWLPGDGHVLMAVWNGIEWRKDTLPPEVAKTAEGSSILGFAAVPGTPGMLTSGLGSSSGLQSTWGVIASLGWH